MRLLLCNGPVKVFYELPSAPTDLKPKPFVDVVQDEVYEVGNKRKGSRELPAAGHNKPDNEGHGYGNKAPGNGFSQ